METLSVPIDSVIEAAGGVTKVARALGIRNPSVVANWVSRGRIPAERVLDFERLTGVSRYVIRPDVFGPAPEAAE